MKIAIYGAQGYALGTYKALKTLYPEKEIPFFIVSAMEGNPATLAGIPVKLVSEVSEFYSEDNKDDLEIIIATPENIQQNIEETLDEYGFFNHSRLTSDRWGELMGAYYAIVGEFEPLEIKFCGVSADTDRYRNNLELDIFYARSHKDKALKMEIIRPYYMHAIQVGAANTGERIADITDDIGDNISFKNGNYCELTGLYWIWKNMMYDDCSVADSERDGIIKYFGFAQYRRSFDFVEDDLERLISDDIDVLLPYQLMYEPDINMHHERYLKDGDWKALLAALEELQPEYVVFFQRCLDNSVCTITM